MTLRINSSASSTIPGPATVTGTLTVTGQILAADGTTPLPGYAFASNSATGFSLQGGKIRTSINGVDSVEFGNAYVWVKTSSASIQLGASADVVLNWGAADTLHQRRGTNQQAYQLFETYTDASNGAWLQFSYNAGGTQWFVLTNQNGTGSARALTLGTVGNNVINFRTNNTNCFQFSTSGHFLATTDNTFDIGASAATRPRNVYIAGLLTLSGGTLLATSAALTNGAAAQVATMTNGPTAGNPTRWVPINDNGTTRYIPMW